MSFVAVGIGSAVAGVGSAVIGANAASSAADKQAAAAQQATDLQRQEYNQTREDQAPWRNAGVGALSQLQDPSFQKSFTLADFQQDPGYQFRMDEGQKALERSAAAKGGLQNGGTMKAIAQYGQNFASNEYNNAYNRFNADRDSRFSKLSSLAGLGQTANSQIGVAGQNYANQAGQNITGAANAQGAAGIAGANAWSSGIGNLSNVGRNWADYSNTQQYLNSRLPPSPYGG